MWVIDTHQLFYIDETGALCHAMSGLAVDVLGIYKTADEIGRAHV